MMVVVPVVFVFCFNNFVFYAKLCSGLCGGMVALRLVHLPLTRAVRVQTLARDTVLCSWARHFTLTVPLYTQVYKWVQANLMLGISLQWTSILSREETGAGLTPPPPPPPPSPTIHL